jgi:hypothetical protein
MYAGCLVPENLDSKGGKSKRTVREPIRLDVVSET